MKLENLTSIIINETVYNNSKNQVICVKNIVLFFLKVSAEFKFMENNSFKESYSAFL